MGTLDRKQGQRMEQKLRLGSGGDSFLCEGSSPLMLSKIHSSNPAIALEHLQVDRVIQLETELSELTSNLQEFSQTNLARSFQRCSHQISTAVFRTEKDENHTLYEHEDYWKWAQDLAATSRRLTQECGKFGAIISTISTSADSTGSQSSLLHKLDDMVISSPSVKISSSSCRSTIASMLTRCKAESIGQSTMIKQYTDEIELWHEVSYSIK